VASCSAASRRRLVTSTRLPAEPGSSCATWSWLAAPPSDRRSQLRVAPEPCGIRPVHVLPYPSGTGWLLPVWSLLIRVGLREASRVIWAPGRNKAQGLLVSAMYERGKAALSEREAALVGGLPGADKKRHACPSCSFPVLDGQCRRSRRGAHILVTSAQNTLDALHPGELVTRRMTSPRAGTGAGWHVPAKRPIGLASSVTRSRLPRPRRGWAAKSDLRFGFGFVPDRHMRRIPCLVTGGLLEPGFGFGEPFPAGFACLGQAAKRSRSAVTSASLTPRRTNASPGSWSSRRAASAKSSPSRPGSSRAAKLMSCSGV
jgi:hypothetical protein